MVWIPHWNVKKKILNGNDFIVAPRLNDKTNEVENLKRFENIIPNYMKDKV